MTAVEGKADAVGALVLQWQGAAGELQRRNLGNTIMRMLQPMIRTVAASFANRSVQVEDLEQVAAIAAFRLLNKPLNPNYTFEGLACFRARSACREYVAMHGSDVHVSDWAARSRQNVDGVERASRGKATLRVSVESRDGEPAQRHEQREESTEDISFDITDARLGAAIESLTPHKREVIKAIFGIDRNEESVRSLTDRLGVSRGRLSRVRDDALADLRALLDSEP